MASWTKRFCKICGNPVANHDRPCNQERHGKKDLENKCNICHRPLQQHKDFCQPRRGISPRYLNERLAQENTMTEKGKYAQMVTRRLYKDRHKNNGSIPFSTINNCKKYAARSMPTELGKITKNEMDTTALNSVGVTIYS